MPVHRASPLYRRLFWTALLGAMVTIGGCDQPPPNERFASDLAAYVDSGFASGLLNVTRAERLDRGVLPLFTRGRRTVSFVADLRLKRDYDFGVWDQANAATLIYLLGARAEGLAGIKSDGNAAGDEIHVTGAVVYRRNGEQWTLESAPALPLARQTSPAASDRLELFRQWRRISALTLRALVSPSPAAVTDDLTTAANTASARLTRQGGALTLASGPVNGAYWGLAQAIAETKPHDKDPDAKAGVVNVATRGSLENLRLLRDDAVTAIVLRGDEAAMAADGEPPFDRSGAFRDLRALATLFPEQIHVVVMNATALASVADLFGRRVVIAAAGPAAATAAGDILRAHGVALTALKTAPLELPVEQALAALARGDCDAVILTAPAPSTALRDFAVAPGVRLLPMDADAVALLTTGISSYVAVTMAAQTYPGQPNPIATVGVTAQLVSSARIPAAETEALLNSVFSDVDFLARGHAMGAMIKRPTALRGLTLPLHSGAVAFFGRPLPAR